MAPAGPSLGRKLVVGAISLAVFVGTAYLTAPIFWPEYGRPAATATPADSQRVIFAAAAIQLVRRELREPESVAWEYVAGNDDANMACIEYRARNGLGGYTRERVVVSAASGIDRDPAAWVNYCGSPRFRDVRDAAVARAR